MGWRVAIRVDASKQIGSGHVVRCLTLANLLYGRGAEVTFVCREHDGNLGAYIESRGFKVEMLSCSPMHVLSRGNTKFLESSHADWLGVAFEKEAVDCQQILEGHQWDWIIVDHYGLDARWEANFRSLARRIMVIDDLADRPHDCDLLLDQSLGRRATDYKSKVPVECCLLTGPTHGLLRPEFAELRAASLARRKGGGVKQVLVSMGGVDLPNATGRVLDVLATLPAMADVEVLVVMGQSSPWLAQIREQASRLPFQIDVRVDITDMAQQMHDCDLSIGAAGGTSWERCCLGVPTILVVLAENQFFGAQALGRAGAAFVIDSVENIPFSLPCFLSHLQQKENMVRMQEAAAAITDGLGTHMVVDVMEAIYGR